MMGWIARLRRLRHKRSDIARSWEGDPFVALSDPHPRRRWEAASVLGQHPMPTRAAEALVRALGDPEPFVRWQAGRSLLDLPEHEALRALRDALNDASPVRRAAAAEALGEAPWRQALPLLVEALSDQDAGVRVAAALSLGRIGRVEVIEPLATRMEQEPSPGVRWALVRALGMVGVPAGAEPLQQCLTRDGEEAPVRRSAAWALGQLSWDPAVVDGLLTALDDPDPQVRWHACLGLGNIAQTALRSRNTDRELLERVQEALARRREDGADAGQGLVGEAASQALAQIHAGLWRRRKR